MEIFGESVEKNKQNKISFLKHYNFELDVNQETLNFLKEKSTEILQIQTHAYTRLGEVFIEAQEKLAGNNHYDGIFEKWYKELGFKKTLVYRLISRTKLINEQKEDKERIEALPLSLSYKIANEKCSKKLKNKVLNGEINSLKQYNDLEKKNTNNQKEIEISPEEFEELKNYFFEKMNNFNKEDCNIAENNIEKANNIFRRMIRELVLLEKLE